MEDNKTEPILDVTNLQVSFKLDEGQLKAVDNVSFSLEKGKILGIVGESGCGKSVTAQAIMRIVPKPGSVEGKIHLKRADDWVDLAAFPDEDPGLRAIRGKNIAMIFQEPMTSFSAHYTIGNQIMEAVLLHRTKDPAEARKITIEAMRRVGIAAPEQRIDNYPHEFSGGMRQRAMIAMALACRPEILIADEPTTALDVTIQAQVLELMKKLQDDTGMSIILITHDLGVVAETCHEVAVMYLGRIVEKAPVDVLFSDPLHPYTKGLMKSIPRVGIKQDRLATIEGVVPVALDLPPQCGFCSRCDANMKAHCETAVPALKEVKPGHWVRCFLHDESREDINTHE